MKIDLGSGQNKKEGFLGVDAIQFDGKVDIVHDLTTTWPWADSEIEEAQSTHFLEHLEAMQRVHFMNELYRVLKPGGKCLIVVPHWASCRAYGDMTHKWPPVSEFFWYYLSAEWRAANAPHDDVKFNPHGYACDFEATWGYSFHPMLGVRNQEFQQFAMQFYKESCQDMICTLTSRKK